MPTFYATLSAGHRFAHGFPPTPNGGGYVELNAKDYETAHTLMFNRFGRKWAFLYNSLDEVHELNRTLLAVEENRMDPDWKAKWVADLRTPGLAQGKEYLTRFVTEDDVKIRQDCCLGRLCEVTQTPIVHNLPDTYRSVKQIISYEETTTVLPQLRDGSDQHQRDEPVNPRRREG